MNTTKPNILFIMTDQLSANAIGALGNSVVKTPNIDKLVEPQGKELAFEQLDDAVKIKIDEFTCHQMISFNH